MANPVIINPTLTLAGQRAAFNADNNGIELKLDAVSFGRAHYDPTGEELALKNPVGNKVPLAGASRPTPYQIRMVSTWREDVGEVPIGEIAFWSGDVLVFVWSKADGQIASYKTDGVSYVLFNDLAFAQVPANSINVTIDPNESVALAALAAHEGAANAHPQYLLRADVAKDGGPLAWLGTALGTANVLGLALQAKEAVLPAYAPGQRFQFIAKLTNTGSVTANIGARGAKAVKKAGDAGLIDLEPGDIKAGAMYDLNYDGQFFQLGGGVGSGKAFVRYSFTASVAQTVFPADHTVGATIVLRDGREVTDFLSDGAKITMRTPCDEGTSVEILAFKSFKVADSYTKAEYQALLATASALPVGAMIPFPRGKIPPGFLEVNGSKFDPAVYPDLAAYLGGDTLPESRGEHIRGWDNGRGVDPGRKIGTNQAGSAIRQAASNAGTGPDGVANTWNNTEFDEVSTLNFYPAVPGPKQWPFQTGVVRVRNLSAMWCIKAWNAPVNQGNIDVAALAAKVQGFEFGRLLNIRVFTENTIYIPTPGTKTIIAEGEGGGGSGGGTLATVSGQAFGGSGGGAGSYAKAMFTSGFSGIAITIGPGGAASAPGGDGVRGGTTSFGTLLTIPGGVGGTVGAGIISAQKDFGDMPTGGNIVARPGPAGFTGMAFGEGVGGRGADSRFGSGGWAPVGGGGRSGAGYGSGSSGASSNPNPAPPKASVAAQPGILYVYEYM
ncbi:tail fiber protein (plasmid) [Pseudomonas yamanorum]|nr:tail fiber protein [Pseudomonas yamanorum]